MASFTTFLDCGDLGQREVDVGYIHHGGWPDNYLDPPEPEWCEVVRVDFLGKDVVDYVNHNTYSALCQEALERWKG